tara:strand:+ start:120 stop:353 length:234 start_codon:yes stop_codon:yes gene_type:complete
MKLQQQVVQSLFCKYEAQKQEAKVEIMLYFENPVGVADHPDLIGTLDGLLKKYNEADEMIKGLQNLVGEVNENEFTD